LLIVLPNTTTIGVIFLYFAITESKFRGAQSYDRARDLGHPNDIREEFLGPKFSLHFNNWIYIIG